MKRILISTALLMVSIVYQGFCKINVTLPDTSIDAGKSVLIPIVVSDVTDSNITSFQFDLDYDSSVVKPIEVSIENTISEPNGQLYYNLNNSGVLTAAVIIDGTLAGAGSLLTILFEAVGEPEDSTTLQFPYFEFDAKTDIVNTGEGKIRINSNHVTVDFAANVVDDVTIVVDDTIRSLPFSTRWLKNSEHIIDVPDPQDMGTGVQYLFQQWSDGKAKLHTVSSIVDTSFEVTFKTQYHLSVKTDCGVPTGEGWYDSGVTAFFSVDSMVAQGDDTRFKFISWTGIGEGSYSGSERESSVVMTNPITEEAQWLTEYFLNVTSQHGNPYGQGWYTDSSTAEFGIEDTEISNETERFNFDSWTGTGEGSYTGKEPQHELVVNNPISEHAEWKEEYYVRIESNIENIIDTTDTGWYVKGDSLTTSTAPDSVLIDTTLYFFRCWQINDQIVHENPLTMVIDSALVVQALYSKQIQITVTTSVGAGTKVIVDGAEQEAPFSARWLSDDSHTIGVQTYQQVTENTRYSFEKWRHGGERVQNVSPSANERFVAKLDTQYYVSMVSSPAKLCQLPGSDWYVAGSHIELPTVENIIEQSGKYWRFRAWKINDDEMGTDSTFFLVSEPMVVAACFDEAFKITGSIKLDDQPIENVQIIISGDATDTVRTSTSGEYAIPPLFLGNYVIVPQKEGYRFEPEKLSFTPLNTSLNEQDFTAIEIGTELSGEQKQPEKFCLGQNYPNPFNSATSIPIELPHNSVITLKVFNILGQPIKTLIHDNNLTGVQKIQWNGTNDSGESVPSGVYFYKLMIDGRVLTKKMILLE